MKRYKLGEIADVIMGQSPESKYYNTEGKGLPFLQGNRTFGERYPDFDTYTSVTTKKAKAHDVLMSVRAPVGAVNITPIDVCLGRGLCALRMQNGNQDYLYYLMKYYSSQFNKSYGGTIFPSINRDEIKSLIVNIVDDKYLQQRIAKILSTIDAKIELNKKISRELETIAKELYEYWFVQFDFPNAQGKPYKSSGGKMVWNETLKREIPEGWEVKKLGDCLEHINTGLNPRDNFKLGNGNIKYVTVKNIAMDGSIDFSGCDYVNEEARKMIHARSKISKGDILFASISPLGRCFILHEEPKDWDINESVFSIRPRSIINSEYLYEYFRSEWFIKKSEKVATGSIFSGIRIQVLTSLPILIPDKSIIGDLSTKLSNLLCQKEKFSQENMILTNLRNQLLPLLMNGQVRVSEKKVSSVSQKDNTNRFVLWKNTYPVAARGEKNDTVLRAMYEAMDDEDK